MTTGLPISDLIRGAVSLSPRAAQTRNFGSILHLGDSDVIDVVERFRVYTDMDQVGEDFDESTPEFSAATLHFGQNPQPNSLTIGRWASAGTKGLLRGRILSAAQQQLNNFTVINNGSLSILVDGLPHVVTNIDLSAAANLNGVAGAIETAISGFASIIWDANNNRFVIESKTTGTASSVGFATAPGSGTNLGPLLGLDNQPGTYSVQGILPETYTAAVAKFMNMSQSWYMVMPAATATPTTQDLQNAAALIEAASPSRIQGITTADPSTLDPTLNTDVASILKAAGYRRSTAFYSSTTDFAIASMLARAATVDFSGEGTTITLAFKQLPGVTPETLTESQRVALRGKFCNSYLQFDNDTAIVQEGWMASGDWFDAIHGTDWLLNECQTNIWNLYLTTQTKIPQTEAGLNQVITAIVQAMEQGVRNGLLYPGGVWNGPTIGSMLTTGQTLPKGYLVFAPPLATQNQGDRQARKTTFTQAACKLAGAFHSADFLISVNQ